MKSSEKENNKKRPIWIFFFFTHLGETLISVCYLAMLITRRCFVHYRLFLFLSPPLITSLFEPLCFHSLSLSPFSLLSLLLYIYITSYYYYVLWCFSITLVVNLAPPLPVFSMSIVEREVGVNWNFSKVHTLCFNLRRMEPRGITLAVILLYIENTVTRTLFYFTNMTGRNPFNLIWYTVFGYIEQ